MGLDQYAYALEKSVLDTTLEAGFKLPNMFDWDENDFLSTPRTNDPVFGFFTRTRPGVTQLAYWRKHPNLHGLIHQLAKSKLGWTAKCEQWESLCAPVRLSLDDIDAIEKRTRDGTLPSTSGFFFGESRTSDDEPTLEFCRRAKAAIADGKIVVYDSSW